MKIKKWLKAQILKEKDEEEINKDENEINNEKNDEIDDKEKILLIFI